MRRPFLTTRYWLLGGMLVASCAPGVTTGKLGAAKSPRPEALGTPAIAASTVPKSFFGQVLGLDGQPAANVDVFGYLVSDQGGVIISDQGSGIVSNNGGGVVSNNGAGFRVAAAEALHVKTAADGTFRLSAPGGEALNIEAVQQKDIKALQLAVASSATGLVLRLQHTGTIAGRVTAPAAPTVTDFTGVDVYIPGLPYSLKTGPDGSFTLSNVPAGTFTLIASKAVLGSAKATGVLVQPEKTTSLPPLALSVVVPTIDSLTPANGGKGAEVTIAGSGFGASTGEAIAVRFGGATATARAIDDHTLKAVVPEGAVSGNVVVSIGGVDSNARPFKVLGRIVPDRDNFVLPLGQTVAIAVEAEDDAGQQVAAPVVTYTLTGAAARLADGVVTPIAPGLARLRIASGSLATELAVLVTDHALMVDTLAGSPGSNGAQDGVGTAARFDEPRDLAWAGSLGLLVTEQHNAVLRRVQTDGTVSVFAGTFVEGYTNGPRLSVQLKDPGGVAVDGDGTIYIAEDTWPRIRRIRTDGTVETIAGTGKNGYADGPGAAAQFHDPHGLVLDGKGHLYLADRENHAIRMVDLKSADFKVSTLAGSGNNGYRDAVGAQAEFSAPDQLALQADGRLLVSDSSNHCLRVLTFGAEGAVVTTLAGQLDDGDYADRDGLKARFGDTYGLALDAAGDVYITSDNRIRKLLMSDSTHPVFTVAGTGVAGHADGPALSATFEAVRGMVVGPDGTLYVADKESNAIRRLK